MNYFVIDASRPHHTSSGAYFRQQFSTGVAAPTFDAAVQMFREARPDATIHAVNKRGTIDLIFQEVKIGH